jgi:murein hydrolase activator
METGTRRLRVWRLVLTAYLPLLLGAAAVERDLEGIKKKIESEKKGLSRIQVRESQTRQSLAKIEAELEKRNQQLKLAEARLVSLASEIAAKKIEAENLEASMTQRRELLHKRAAALYRWQRSGGPNLALSTEGSPGHFFRRRRYLETAIDFDQELLAKLHEESRRHARVQEELARNKDQLNEQQRAITRAQQAVSKEAEKRKVLLASLTRERESRLRSLKQMESAALRLQKMMEEIARRSAVRKRESPPAPSTGAGLDIVRGRLEWPVTGRVIAPFGKYKHPEFAAEVNRKGIDFDAAMGQNVQAVERGRIVYADQFSGYGRMVIVDHGERYYSIYGHLSEILKKTGEEVRRGEALGRVGDSDSIDGTKLYFELRKDGRSLDPLPWFQKR